MNLRRIAAAALAAGVVLVPVAPASATCYVGQVDICNKPTDPYTDPLLRPVNDVVSDVLQTPAVRDALITGGRAAQDAYITVLCLTDDYSYC